MLHKFFLILTINFFLWAQTTLGSEVLYDVQPDEQYRFTLARILQNDLAVLAAAVKTVDQSPIISVYLSHSKSNNLTYSKPFQLVSTRRESFVSVRNFLDDCAENYGRCLAFVMGVVEGARHQTRERLKSQPFAFTYDGKPVCLPNSWGSHQLTKTVVETLSRNSQLAPYSAVSGVLYALSSVTKCAES